MNETIALRNLSIGYKIKNSAKVIAKDINATVLGGELTCLLGANGIGKSTLLRTLAAFQPKLSGDIIIQGTEIDDYSEKKLSTLIGIVLTERIDLKNMTVRDLVALGRSPYTGFWGKLTSKDNTVIENAIALVKIEKLVNRMVDTLSDGERQKVMIAKALAQDTPIILLDEPTAFLDFPSKVEVMQLLHSLSRKTEKTIFLSTHDLELALQLADKVWLMDDNTNIHIGTPEDLSLNGDLSNFFARKGIIFDENIGLFRIENDYDRKIKLIGEGQHYSMVRKALLRNRIFANSDIDSFDKIEIKENRIFISLQNQDTIPVLNIEEMLAVLKR